MCEEGGLLYHGLKTYFMTCRLKLVLNYEVSRNNKPAIIAFASAGVAERINPPWVPESRQDT